MDSLLEIIDGTLSPWARDTNRQRIIAGGTSLRKNDAPEGVTITRKFPAGPRIRLKKRAATADPTTSAHLRWPHDGLDESPEVPMVVCIYDGHVDFGVGDSVVHCGPGYFILVPPGVRHSFGLHYNFDPQSPGRQFCDLLWIGRFGRNIRVWTCHSEGDLHCSREGAQADFHNYPANAILDFLIAEAVSNQPGQELVCRGFLCTLLSLLSRDLASNAILPTGIAWDHTQRLALGDNGSSAPADPIERAKAYINNHFGERLTIDSAAQIARLSRAQFTKLFRQKTGKTFAEYLTECRIEQAKSLLTQSDWGIQHISKIVGLGTSSYFCKVFAKQTGNTPQHYRISHK